MQELNGVREDCYALVKQRARVSATTSAIPVVGIDIAADIGILLKLIPEINQRFGLAKHQVADYSPAIKSLILGNANSGNAHLHHSTNERKNR